MKKSIFGIIAIIGILFWNSNEANAQLSVKGTFVKEKIPKTDRYLIGCQGTEGICGRLGPTYPDGGQYFKASDGSEWIIYPIATRPEDVGT